ncbi:hypothetical protein DY000_02053210 [Brassica cretica]|uniref:Uncharacterized protein n=1 Tax=Brassica cretica TaxID=69181 RepID=A0ABQ7AMP4_BRACR|nr:hypothetical protein DY000_02053210 [Brassica cretica]
MHGFLTSQSSYVNQRSGLTGRHLATGSVNRPVTIWRLVHVLDRSPYGDRFTCSAGFHMATGSSARPVAIWRPVHVLDQFVCSTGRHMASGSDSRPVAIWRPVQMLDRSLYSDRFVCSSGCSLERVFGKLVLASVGIDIDLRFFEELANISRNPGTPNTFYINIKSRYGILKWKLNKTHEWFQCYFFVRIDPASVADLNTALKGNWNPSPSRASSDFASSVDWLL